MKDRIVNTTPSFTAFVRKNYTLPAVDDVMPSLPLSVSTRIPQEVVEHILDMLVGAGSSALARCALVCRAWNYHSTLILYTTIQISRTSKFAKLVKAALQHPRTRQYLARTKHLSLMDPGAGAPCAHLVVYSLAAAMRNLGSITFMRCCWLSIHSSFSVLLPQFQSVTKVFLCAVTFSNFAAFKRVICSFQSLEVLELTYCATPRVSQRALVVNVGSIDHVQCNSHAPVLVRLRCLKWTWGGLDHDILRCTAKWLNIPGIAEGLSSLSLNGDTSTDAIGAFVRPLGSRLCALQLSGCNFVGTYIITPIEMPPLDERQQSLKDIYAACRSCNP